MQNNVDNPFKSPAIISLCTGMRGLERGIERAIGSIRTVAYVEIEAFIIENLVRQMEQGILDPALIHSNLKTFPFGQFRNKVHAIIGGYPCQPFSVAGNRGGASDPRHLWPFIKEGIDSARPIWCFFENVPGHLTLGYEQVRNDLQKIGYTVEEGIYSAAEAGAPHQRKRLFILALANSFCSGIGNISRDVNREIGQSDVQQGYREECTIRFIPTSELGNSESGGTGRIQNTNGERKGYGPAGTSGISAREQELANARLLRQKERQEQTEGLEQHSEAVANTDNSGSGQNTKQSEFRTNSSEQSSINSGTSRSGENEQVQSERWPSRPNEQQHDWEEPRVKSRLGFTIDGYNFREDLLRMAGNGVVEQTAELAFIDLLNKHFTNNK